MTVFAISRGNLADKRWHTSCFFSARKVVVSWSTPWMCFTQLAALLDHLLILLLTGSLTWILDLRIRRKTFKIGITRYGEVIDCTFNTSIWNTSVRIRWDTMFLLKALWCVTIETKWQDVEWTCEVLPSLRWATHLIIACLSQPLSFWFQNTYHSPESGECSSERDSEPITLHESLRSWSVHTLNLLIYSFCIHRHVHIFIRFLWGVFWRVSDSISPILTIYRCTLHGKLFSSKPLSACISESATGPCQQRRSRGSVQWQISGPLRVLVQYLLLG